MEKGSNLRDTRLDLPAYNPEAREQQMIAKAERLAERQLEDGTASAQVIVHYLKLGTARENLEREILKTKNELMTAQTETLKAAQRIEALYQDAAKMFKIYSGQDDEDIP